MMSLLIILSTILCVYIINVNASILRGTTRLRDRNKLTNSVSDLRYHFSASSNHNKRELPQFDSIHNLTPSHPEDECSNQTKPLYDFSCLSINGSTTAYRDVIKCINNVTYIMRGYWIGYHNFNSDQVVVGFCKFCNSFYSTSLGRYVQLNLTNQCLQNRDNRLCSCCIIDKAPAINSRKYACIECNPKTIAGYFAYNIIGFFILLAFIFIFNFFPASGALNPLIFFAQMITTTLRLDCAGTIPMTSVFGIASNVDDILQYVSDFIYGIWNLDFTNPANSFCFKKSFQTIDVLAIDYFVAALPLIPVFVLALLARCLDKLQNRGGRTCKQIFGEDCVHCVSCNCLRAFPWLQKIVRFKKWRSIKTLVASCLLLSYTKFAVTTIFLITPSYLYNEDGTEAEKVLYYQGNLKYFGPKHKMLGLLAIFFMVTFVIGFPMLLLLLRYKSHKDMEEKREQDQRQLCKPSICKHFDDILQTCLLKPFQRDLKWGKRNSRPCVGFKIWRFSFGIHDYRWYAGWYFILRFSLFVANILSMDFVEQLLLQQILCTVMLIISLVLQPYRHKRYNRLDSFIFILISIINVSVFYQYYRMTNNLLLSKSTYVVQYILVFIPQVLIILYFFGKLVANYYRNHDDTGYDEELEPSEITPLSSATQTRRFTAYNNQRFKPCFLCNCYVNDNEEQEENIEEQQRPRNYGASINSVPVPLASD